MHLTALYLWQTRLKEASTAVTSIPTKPDSAVANAPTLIVVKSGGDKMGLMMCDGKFVSRDEVALVPTPCGTESWKPVPQLNGDIPAALN